MNHSLLGRTERYQRGKALRAHASRESHADFSVPQERDALDILVQDDKLRLPKLLPERYRRMSQDAFSFLRGAAAIMAEDLAHHPSSGALVQACGDCHLMNFGAFLTPEDNIMFNVNDFDETLPGVDFTVDLKRLAASVAVAAQTAQISKKESRSIVAATVAAYRKHMRLLAELAPLDAWHSVINLQHELAHIGDKGLRRSLGNLIAKAQGKSAGEEDNFPHLTRNGGLRIADKPPMIFHLDPTSDAAHIDASRAFNSYRRVLPPERVVILDRYHLADLAFKAVGIGSIGTFCFVGLFKSGDDECLFLQVKEARKSVLERLAGVAPFHGQQGRRVVEGHRMMQAATDIFLGWTADEASGREYYVRRLKIAVSAVSRRLRNRTPSRTIRNYAPEPWPGRMRDPETPPSLLAISAGARHSTMRWRLLRCSTRSKPRSISIHWRRP